MPQPLHPLAQKLIDDSHASPRPNAHLLPVEEARANFDGDLGGLAKPEVARVEDVQIPTRDGEKIPARLFVPTDAAESLPIVVYFHGGGWLLGSIESHEAATRLLALASGAAVLSVGYRRGPESRFPTAAEDAYDAVVWAAHPGNLDGVDVRRIAVAGDSAGGNLAASAAISLRESQEVRLAHQLLVYPVTTCDLETGFDLDYEGVMLYRDEMQWHQDNYLGSPDDARDPRVSVLDAELAGLPATSVVLAECDPIRPQGALLADALRAAGVAVEVHETPGMIHGFFGLEELFPTAADAMAFAGKRLAAAFDEDGPREP
ncbi:alpha/beta hydrolase [Pimelobacter simplex]|uniref:Alpha/beta hydrolase n=1 Tax=Nocardioides simplex TaxID=2045 RepID=A0A7J5DS77_NOCSI|nr:alpha/beta hydrolase [Pimelobacter simplex]KAB2807839.1 alpha/beta hydrolase [Pimelobacter simplex]